MFFLRKQHWTIDRGLKKLWTIDYGPNKTTNYDLPTKKLPTKRTTPFLFLNCPLSDSPFSLWSW